jgi:hypothetical protein
MNGMEQPKFSAWSLLTLTATAHGVMTYPDELGARYVYDSMVPNGRYIAVGDLAVVRDNKLVFGAGWIDSIQVTPGRKIRLRCPNCGTTDFKIRLTRDPRYRCAKCHIEFDNPVEEELEVEVFSANYGRTWRLADRPFPARLLDTAYTAKAQQNAIRRLDGSRLRRLFEDHLVTGEPWWNSYVEIRTSAYSQPGGNAT